MLRSREMREKILLSRSSQRINASFSDFRSHEPVSNLRRSQKKRRKVLKVCLNKTMVQPQQMLFLCVYVVETGFIFLKLRTPVRTYFLMVYGIYKKLSGNVQLNVCSSCFAACTCTAHTYVKESEFFFVGGTIKVRKGEGEARGRTREKYVCVC